MTRSDIIRRNARIIRQHVRGQTKKERRECYALLSTGPIGLALHVIAMISKASNPVTVNVTTNFDAELDRITAKIRGSGRVLDSGFRQ